MEDYKKIGAIHRLGIYLFPYVFGWSVIKGNYSPAAKIFTKIYLFFVAGLMFVAMVLALPAPQNGKNVDELADGDGRAVGVPANTVSSAIDGRVKVSFGDKSIPDFKKFSGIYGVRADSSTTLLYSFRQDGMYADVPDFMAERFGKKTVKGIEFLDESCADKSDNYGNIGDDEQVIGLNFRKNYRLKDAYYYQLVCHSDEGVSGIIFVASDMSSVHEFSRCNKDDCESGNMYPEISGLIYFEEQSDVLPFVGTKGFVSEQFNPDGTYLEISHNGKLKVEHPSRVRVDRDDAIYESQVEVIYEGRFVNPLAMPDGSIVHIKSNYVTIENGGKLERLDLFNSEG